LDSILFVKRDALNEILLAITINFGIGFTFWGLVGWIFWFNNVIASGFGIIVSTLLIIRLSGMTQGFWFDAMKIESGSSYSETVSYEEEEILDSEKTEEVVDGERVTPFSVFIKAQVLSIVWVMSSVIFAGFILNSLEYRLGFYVLGFLVVLLPSTILLHTGNVIRAMRSCPRQWKRAEKRVSILRKLLSFPEEVFPSPSPTLLRFDLLVTFLVLVASVVLNIALIMPSVVHWILLYLSIALGLRFVVVNHRWSNTSSNRYSALELFINFTSLVAGFFVVVQIVNAAWVWPFYYSTLHLIGLYSSVVWSLYSVYLIFDQVAIGNRLWSSTSSYKVKESEKDVVEKDKLVEKSKRHYKVNELKESYIQAQGMMLAIYVLVLLVSSMVYLVNSGNFYIFSFTWNLIWLVGITIVSSCIITIQYLWRYIRVSRNPDRSIIGGRTRFEALIDGLIMMSILFLFFSGPAFLEDIISRFLTYSPTIPYFVITLASFLIAFAYLSLYLAPFIRFVGDLIGLSFGENNSANRAIIVSGILFVLSAAVIAGMYGSDALWDLTPGILYLIAAPVIVQVVSSYLKISNQNVNDNNDLAKEGKPSREVAEVPDALAEESYTPPKQ
jgi:hypothetical protein